MNIITFIVLVIGSLITGVGAFIALFTCWRKRNVHGFLVIIFFCFFSGYFLLVQTVLLLIGTTITNADVLQIVWLSAYIPATTATAYLFAWLSGQVDDQFFRKHFSRFFFLPMPNGS